MYPLHPLLCNGMLGEMQFDLTMMHLAEDVIYDEIEAGTFGISLLEVSSDS